MRIALAAFLLSALLGCGRVRFVPGPPLDAGADADAFLVSVPDAFVVARIGVDAPLPDASLPDDAPASLDAFAPDDAPPSLDAFAADTRVPDAFNRPDAPTVDASMGALRVLSIGLDENDFAEGNFSCALQSDGRIACWGGNQYGQLGDGTTERRAHPTEVVGIRTATQLAVGGTHACAVLASGQVFCWGRNLYGELGTGALGNSSVPVEATVVAGAAIVGIDAGVGRTCVVRIGGAVDCWGSAIWRADSSDALTPDRVWPGGVERVDLGAHMIATFQAGGVTEYVGSPGWGVAWSSSPTRLVDSLGANLLTQSFVMGWDHGCAALVDGRAVCMGRDEGKSGDGPPDDVEHATPVVVLDVADAVEVAAGAWHACARLRDGHVSCWGSNSSGELGDGGAGGSGRTATSAVGITTAVQIEAGWSHSCALLADGSVQCWGSNGTGQLGTGDFGSRSTPTPVVGLPLP